MKRTAAVLSALVLVTGLGACASEPQPVASAPAAAATGQELPTEVASMLAELGVEEEDVRDAVVALDQVDAPRPLPVQGSVRTDEVVFSGPGVEEVAVPIPGDEVYVSVAPYVSTTHDCHFHALGGCQGELVGEDVQVTIVDDDGSTLVEEDATTYTNGFVGFWLPKDTSGTITVTRGDLVGEADFDTHADEATCVTTLQLS